MLPVTIDTTDTIGEFSLTREQAQQMNKFILDSVVDSFVRQWEEEVDNSLHSTRAEYKKGIFQESPDENTIIVGLTPRQSKLSMMLEDGVTQFDIKAGMENSDKRHLKQNGGWYISIPFRYATAEALGESMSFANKLPKPIQKLVKNNVNPLQIGQIPSPYNKTGQNQTSGYTHKFNIYEGLHREEIGSGSKEKRGAYMNFRRISDKSDKDAFIHPGLEALKLMEKSMNQIDIGNIVDHAIDEFLSK